MLINTDLSADTSSLARSQNRAEAGTAATATPALQNHPPSSQLDTTLQRLASTPLEAQDAAWEIQDEAGAAKATSFARQSILNQPGMAMTAQANQLSQNVLNLLQPAD